MAGCQNPANFGIVLNKKAVNPISTLDPCPWQPDPAQIPGAQKLPAIQRFAPAEIVVIDESAVQLALLHLGVRVGDHLRLTHIAPLGDPIAISINGTKIAIRKQDATHIWVKPVH